MFYDPDELKERAEIYCNRLNLSLVERLGGGLQGLVFLTSSQSAIKVHSDPSGYSRELRAYSRLEQHNVRKLRSFIIPTLRAFDEKLLILEISVVKPPFILDFGGAYLDAPPAHAQDVDKKGQWMEERIEKFGERVKIVNSILADLETRYGIFLTDVHPGNIKFE